MAWLSSGECVVTSVRRSAASATLEALLGDAERERLGRLKRAEDRQLYVVAHAVARVLLAAASGTSPEEVSYDVTCRRCSGPHGKPVPQGPASGLDMSLAHSGDWVVVGVSSGAPIGVDVERVDAAATQAAVDVAEMALSPTERTHLAGVAPSARGRAVLTTWVRKEAVLKATGDGLTVEPSLLTVTPWTEHAALLQWSGRTTPPATMVDLAPDARHVGAVAVLGAARVRHIDAAEVL